MIVFGDLKIRNFLSFGDTETTIKLDRSPTTLITGKNGQGKSSIGEAFCFALTGKSFRGINKPALVNTTNQKACLVTLTFRKGDDEYTVKRGIKPNIFSITKNGTDMSEESDVRDMQEVLEGILGFDYGVLIKTILIGTANYKPFLQLTTPERRAIVDTLLNVGIYTKMGVINKVAITNWKVENDLLASKMTAAERLYESATTSYKNVVIAGKERLESLRTRLADAEKELSDLKVVPEPESFSLLYPSAKEAMRKLEDGYRRVSDIINKELSRRETLKVEIINREAADDKLKSLGERRDEVTYTPVHNIDAGIKTSLRAENTKISEELGAFKSQMMTLKETIDFFGEHDHCETCKQEISSSHSESIIAEKKILLSNLVVRYKELDTKRQENLDTLADIERKEQENQTRRSEVESTNAEIRRVNSEIDAAALRLETIKTNIERLNQTSIKLEDVESLRSGILESIQKERNNVDEDSVRSNRHAELLQEYNRYVNASASSVRNIQTIKGLIDEEMNSKDSKKFVEAIEDAKKEVDSVAEERKAHEYRKTVLDATAELLKDNGIKASVIKKYIPILNDLVNKYLEVMGAQYQIVLDENFNDSIKGRYKDEFTYLSLSQGERQRVDIAFLFATIKIGRMCSGIESNVLFLDEVADSSMDFDGCEAIFQIIESAYGDKNVLLVSHRVEMTDKCRSVIRLEKREGFTKII